MRSFRILTAVVLILSAAASAPAFFAPASIQGPSSDWKERIVQELQSRIAKITPRKLKTRGKPKVARWEDVDATLADAQSRLDLRETAGIALGIAESQAAAVRSSLRDELSQVLAQHPVSYGQLFLLDDPAALFPLTNNVLRLGTDTTWTDLQVFDKTGFSLGRYAGKYVFEKSGGLSSGNSGYRLTYFQYRDNEGNIRPSGTANLLDTYLVRWSEIKDKPGLVLTAEMLLP